MSKPEILVVAALWPRYMQALQQAYVVHDRTHLQDPAQFASIAARIRGIAASGESKVDADLLARLRCSASDMTASTLPPPGRAEFPSPIRRMY